MTRNLVAAAIVAGVKFNLLSEERLDPVALAIRGFVKLPQRRYAQFWEPCGVGCCCSRSSTGASGSTP